MKKKLLFLAFCLAGNFEALANSTADSAASTELSALSSAELIHGSLHGLAAAGSFVIASVQTSGEFINLGLQASGQALTLSVKISKQAVGNLSLATGQSVQVMATGSGYLLQQSGKVIAFIPTKIGETLLFSRVI